MLDTVFNGLQALSHLVTQQPCELGIIIVITSLQRKRLSLRLSNLYRVSWQG